MGNDPLVGTTIEGRWSVGEPIGRGGMSRVYLGHDELGGVPVAIKILKPGLKPELRSVERFRREARAAATVDHPNVISIESHGELEGGLCYLVMELADGVSLGRAIRLEAPFGPRRAVRVASQIAAAMARAHELGVLHRDLKPANVVLSHRRGEPDVVKVLDFGLAKILGHDDDDTLTKAGLIFGTPEYMSPEQAVGGKVDGRCDVYALGAILYEMLVGRPPFRGEGVFETVRMHVAEPPPAPRDVRSDVLVPPMLEGVVLRCLEKRPEGRFESAAHLERVLAAIAAQLDRVPGAGEVEPDSGLPDSRQATMTVDRAALLDAGEAASAEHEQLRRHRKETLRRASARLSGRPVSRPIGALLERIARLEQLAVDRGADLAVAESRAEDERTAVQDEISRLRLAYIDLQMEATRLRDGPAEAEGGAPAGGLDAVVAELERIAAEVRAGERDLAQRLEAARKERKRLVARYADAEDAVDQCFDEVAALVRQVAMGTEDEELAALLSDLESFDRWIAAHQAAASHERLSGEA